MRFGSLVKETIREAGGIRAESMGSIFTEDLTDLDINVERHVVAGWRPVTRGMVILGAGLYSPLISLALSLLAIAAR